MISERNAGINPEDFKAPIPDQIEATVSEELSPNPVEIVAKETDLLAKFRGKAQKLAKVLILFTSLSLGCAEKKVDLEKPRYTMEDVEEALLDNAQFLNNARYFKEVSGFNLAKHIQLRAERDPQNFFKNAKYFQDIPGLNLAELVVKVGEMDPEFLLKNAKELKNIPGLNLVNEILKALENEKLKAIEHKYWLDDVEKIKYEAGLFLNNVRYLKDIPELNLAKKTHEFAELDRHNFFKNAEYFTDIPGFNLAVEISLTARKGNPDEFFKRAVSFKDIPGLNLLEEILVAKKFYPEVFFKNAKYLKDVPGLNLAQEMSKLAENEPFIFLEYAKYFKNIIGLDLKFKITQASELDPLAFINFFQDLKDVFSESELSLLTEKIFRDNPKLLNSEKSRQFILDIKKPQLASTEIIKKISNVHTLILLNHMIKHGLSESAAEEIMRDDNKFLQTLVEIKSEPDHIGKNDVELALKNHSLQEIQEINDLHDQSNSVRFASVNSATPSELYTIMVYGEEEVFTSSFNGLFDILIKKMHKNNFNGKKLLEQVGQNKFRIFIKQCSSFNRLNEFLDTMDKESAEQLLSNIVSNIDTAKDRLAQATIVADIFRNIQNEDILKVLQKQIKLEYERVANSPESQKEDKILYGILSGMFAEKAVVNEAWIKEMADKFKLENLNTLKSSDLFNADNTNVQQYFFYDDKDGHASFKHFLDQYQNQPDWHITQKEHFVLIKQEKNGKILEIYANYPKFQTEGPEEIDVLLKEKNIQTITVVHRGHSYHAQQTIDRIPPTAKIVSLGSCGGYSNIEQVLKRAPKAHILSTKGTGTMLVNDPLLKTLNMEILSGKNIEWPTFWEKMQKKVGNNDNFKNYVPPHKNLGAMFLKTYFQELEK